MSQLRTLADITRECFGDRADELLRNGVILPLKDSRPDRAKQCTIAGWNKTGFRGDDCTDFHSLAVICGRRSGITVWDFDDLDVTPCPVDPPNIITEHGCHVWAEYSGERRSIGLLPQLDVLGDGGYAIFYAPGKRTFIHRDLTPSRVMADLTGATIDGPDRQLHTDTAAPPGPDVHGDTASSTPIGADGFYYNRVSDEALRLIIKKHSDEVSAAALNKYYSTSPSSPRSGASRASRTSGTYSSPGDDYPKDVDGEGWQLDIDSIVAGEFINVARAKPGARNTRLHGAAVELRHCRVDPFVLIPAALHAGVDEDEAVLTIRKVMRTYDAFQVSDVLTQVIGWMERWAAHYQGRDTHVALIRELGRHAVEQNDLTPFIPQNLLRVPVLQPTKSKYLRELADDGAISIKSRGRDSSHRRRPNYYELRAGPSDQPNDPITREDKDPT